MPLLSGTSDKTRNRNIGTLMGEVGESPHVQSRAQAIAIGYSKQREAKAKHKAGGGRSVWRPGSSVQGLDTVPSGTKPWVEAVGGGDRQRGLPSDDPNFSTSPEYANLRALQQGLPEGEPITDPNYPSADEPGYQGGGPAAPAAQRPPANPQMPYGQFGPPPDMFSPTPLAEQSRPAVRPPPRRPLPPSVGPRSARDLTEKLRMFYEHRNELRPDQQQHLMRMLGQDPDKPFAAKPYLDWNELERKHDIPESTHEKFLYYPPYRGAQTGGTINSALHIAHKLATGGDAPALPLMSAPGTPGPVAFKGPINSHIPGRTDKLRLDVAPGSYVIPADVTSMAGEGNTLSGQHLLDAMVPEPHIHARHLQPPHLPGGIPALHQQAPHLVPAQRAHQRARGGAHAASPGNVPIIAAGGEHVLSPQAIANTFRDLDYGHKVLDAYVLQMRAREIKRLKNAPPPKKAAGGAVYA